MKVRRSIHVAFWLLVVLLLVPAPVVCAQGEAPPPVAATAPEPPSVPEAYESPRSTIDTFLGAMVGETPNFAAGIECVDVTGLPPESAPGIALKLYKCMNRIEWVDPADRSIPGVDDLVDRSGVAIARWSFFPPPPTRQPARWSADWRRLSDVQRLAPEGAVIDVGRREDGRWAFTAKTVAGIEALWDALQALDPVADVNEYRTIAERLEDRWPESFIANRFLGVKYWQWISIAALILLGVILDFTVRFILAAVSRRIISRQGGEARRETLRRTVRPFGLAAAAIFWLLAIRHLDLNSDALKVLMPAVRLFVMLAGVWAAYRVTDLVGEVVAGKASRTDTKFDDLLVPLVRTAVKIFITVFGLIYIANSFAIPIAPLLTGLGIGGAGFAFAAKDTLEHFFGSITVISDRPFQVGDWVQIGDVEGTVELVGFRSTRVRTFYNSLVTVPNGNLVRAVVDNFGQRRYRRWKAHLNLTYDTTPESMDAFCEGVRELIRIHPYTRKDYYQVWLHQFGEHSLDVLVYLFFETPDWQTELRERHRMMLDIMRLARRLGVEFAFPTQTLHVHTEAADGDESIPQAPSAGAENRAEAAGRRAVHELTADASWRRRKPEPYVIGHAGAASEDDETQIESKVGGDA